ncbi:MAG: toprim domain-containing protein [bacterium]
MGQINLNELGKPYITRERLLSEVSDENIFRYYISNLEIGKIMKSPLRKEQNPSFGVFYASKYNQLFYKDFKLGSGDCIKFVGELYNISYNKAISQIAKDFNSEEKYKLDEDIKKTTVIGEYVKSSKKTYKKNPKIINITVRDWLKHDLEFWEKFGISKHTLIAYNVFPIKFLFINNNIFPVADHAYAYQEEKDDKVTYKIYQPYSIYKWISNHNKTVHQGYTQLPETGDLLIITKSLKDVMSLCEVMQIPSIGIQNESVLTKNSVIEEYKKRFKKVICLFDNDNAGITLAFRYYNTYGLPFITIPYKYECKDFSDLVKEHGVEESRKILNNLLENVKSSNR